MRTGNRGKKEAAELRRSSDRTSEFLHLQAKAADIDEGVEVSFVGDPLFNNGFTVTLHTSREAPRLLGEFMSFTHCCGFLDGIGALKGFLGSRME